MDEELKSALKDGKKYYGRESQKVLLRWTKQIKNHL